MSKNKVIRRILTVMIIVVLGMFITIYISIQGLNKKIGSVEINNIDLYKVRDGEYSGDYSFKEIIASKVKVTVDNNKITNIDLIEHKYGLGKKAETIISRVIDSQSLNVDVVSGATASSKVILKSIENALTKEKVN
ncbi:FMN-binding protein [Clostridium sp. MSJ-11]|uniref:FMN-binding protein n=1 Tax=Clostridium mobile TaxID=2841512 RepID=A0ABS6EFM5_9CLOT|nr:FMN-binding protein [Clostridium mobile]MBU5483990.1 FMN-binding protein [Clostridium mobile]